MTVRTTLQNDRGRLSYDDKSVECSEHGETDFPKTSNRPSRCAPGFPESFSIMVFTMYTDPTHTHSLLEAAQQGNHDAIARLLQHSLANEGITVNAQVHEEQLDIVLAGTPPNAHPQPEWIISFIQQSVRHLHLQNITQVQMTWPDPTDARSSEQGISLSPSPIMPPPQTESLSRATMQGIVEQFDPAPSSDQLTPPPKLAIGSYTSRWTRKGILITTLDGPSATRWQKRSTVDSAYVCPPITRLLNRQTELKAAIATLQAGGAIEFSGEAGSGKTALLRAICHHPQLLPRFPGGIVYQQAYERPFEDLLQTLFHAVYEERSTTTPPSPKAIGDPSEPKRRKPTALELTQHLSQHQLCLVLDELECSPQILQAWSQWPNLALLASHRDQSNDQSKQQRHQTGAKTRTLLVKGLPLKDAVVLFEEGLGRSLQPGEEKAAEKLCAHLGGHPRRLIQMAALIWKHQASLPDLVQQLQQGTVPEDIILKSVSRLPESDRRVIAILAALSGVPIHGTHLPTLTDLDSVADQLTNLVDQGLVWTDGQFYRLAHNLQAPLQQHWNLAPWIDQALTYFQTWLTQFIPVKGHSPIDSPAYALATVTPVLQNSDVLWCLLGHATHSQQWADVLSLGNLMAPGLWLAQQWGRWRQVLVAQWYAARSLQDQTTEATILHQLGSRALCLEDGLTAHTCLTQAYAHRAALGDAVGAALSQHNLTILADSPFAINTLTTVNSEAVLKPQSPPVSNSSGDSGNQNQSDSPLDNPWTTTPVMLNPIADHQQENAHQPTDHSPPQAASESASTTPSEPTSTVEPTAAVLQTSSPWISWLWIIFGLGSLAVIGFIVFFLGQEPATNISKLRSKHTFPPQRLGVTSDPHQFTITNTATSPITIDIAFAEGDRQEFSINSDDCIREPLPPEETCVIAATFEPQTSGPRAASFLVQVGQKAKPKSLTLQGIGAKVDAEPQPFEINFKEQIVAERSDAKTITFKNKGTVAFMVKRSILTNNEANAFFVEGDNCSGIILQPRDSCNLKVSFLPPEVINYRSILEIVDDSENEIWRIPLMGQGSPPPRPVIPPTPSPPPRLSRPTPPSAPQNTPPPSSPSTPVQAVPHQFSVRPEAIAFDQQELNTASTRTVRIQNEGSMPLNVVELAIADSAHFAVTEESCTGTSILPGNECVVAIAFTPIDAQPYTTTFTVNSTQAGAQTLNIRGTGIPALITLDPNESRPPEPPSINTFAATPSNTVAPNTLIELCYDISGASTAYILDQSTGEEITLNPDAPGCKPQTIMSTTTYMLVANNANNDTIERSLSITVTEPDRNPPSSPVIVGPTGSHPLYCNGPVLAEWKPATDDNGPVNYGINLQRQDIKTNDTGEIESPAVWTPLTSLTSNQTQLDISRNIQAPHVYRWQVQAIDAVGNASPPTAWNEFWCINP